jgi:hypothetical protein
MAYDKSLIVKKMSRRNLDKKVKKSNKIAFLSLSRFRLDKNEQILRCGSGLYDPSRIAITRAGAYQLFFVSSRV